MSSEVLSVVESFPVAFESRKIELNHIKYSFIVGICIFIVLIPFCKSRKSFFDAIAARRVSKALRTAAFCELMCLCILFYQYLTVGNPIRRHAALSYGNGDSWTYGYGRPSAGVIFIGLGLFGTLYPIPRILCIMGCVAQVVGDGISAFQIGDYYSQVVHDSAPGNGYSPHGLMVYYWRDIVSICLSVIVLMLSCFLSSILGWCDPQLIHPAQVTGKDADRFDVLHRMRAKRRQMEDSGIVEKPYLPIFHKKISEFDVDVKKDENVTKVEKKADPLFESVLIKDEDKDIEKVIKKDDFIF